MRNQPLSKFLSCKSLFFPINKVLNTCVPIFCKRFKSLLFDMVEPCFSLSLLYGVGG